MTVELKNAGSVNTSGKIYVKGKPYEMTQEEFNSLPEGLFEIVKNDEEIAHAVQHAVSMQTEDIVTGTPVLTTDNGKDVQIKNNNVNKKGKNKRS